jgi:hypothetical protein
MPGISIIQSTLNTDLPLVLGTSVNNLGD